MRTAAVRTGAIACVILFGLLSFQGLQASASLPATGQGEFNHALGRNDGVASASSTSAPYVAANAIDGSTATYWHGATTTGWLAVSFATGAYVNEIHVHLLSTAYPALTLYLDTNGNGTYEAAEKAWSTTGNKALDVVIGTATSLAAGMRLTIDAKVGSKLPKVAEFEAYLRNDADGDGLTNDQEASLTFYQDVRPGGFPASIPDDGANATGLTATLAPFRGVPLRAFALFTVDHPARAELTASVGHWNGSAWVDRYVWDPGRRTSGGSAVVQTLVSLGGGSSPPAHILGLLASEWSPGEIDAGATATVVAEITSPPNTATAAESASGVLRPGFAPALFQTNLTWRLVLQDWSVGTIGQVTNFTLRFEGRSDPSDRDSDDDTISDRTETASLGTLPIAADSDLDGLAENVEIAPRDLTVTVDGVAHVLKGVRTDPTQADTDRDGLSDGYEVARPTNPLATDTDGDGLGDGAEATSHGSDPTRTDTDADTIPDRVEVSPRDLFFTSNGASLVRSITTLPYSDDSDGDGIRDEREIYGTAAWGVVTDPSDPDTDDDGIGDGGEVYIKEFGLGGRASLGFGGARTVFATGQGPVESVEVRYAVSGADLGTVSVRLDHEGVVGPLLRNGGGSGLFLHESRDVTGAFPGLPLTGTYALVVNAPSGGAVLEEFSIRLRIRTSPIAADSDGDAISDREELDYGVDGYLTDPNMRDTDGDGWTDGYEVSRRTSPRLVDTDADGVWDPSDVDPLRNLMVAVTVIRVHHGSPGWTPTLQGVVDVNGDYVYATPQVGASEDSVCTWYYWDFWSFSWKCGGWALSTAVFYTTYYADVPDHRWDVSIRVQGWSINPLWQDDLLVDRYLAYCHCRPSGYYAETAYNGGHWIRYEVRTVRLDRVRTLAITDGHLSVKDQYGVDRYLSDQRFTVLLIRASYPYGQIAAGFNAVLVPEPLFARSLLKARLLQRQTWPLDGASFYDGDTSKPTMSEGIAGLIAGDLGGYEAWVVLQWLLQDGSGVYVFQAIDVTGRVLALNLPDDVVRVLPYTGVTNSATGPMPEGNFFAKLWNGLVQVGQLIYGGLVAVWDFFVRLGEAIVSWGMRLIGLIAAAIDEVKAAVEKAAETFVASLNWIRDYAIAVFQSVIDGFAALARSVVREVVDAIVGLVAKNLSIPGVVQGVPLVVHTIFRLKGVFKRLLLALEAVEASITAVVSVLSGGVATLVKAVVAGVAKDAVVKLVLGAVLASIAITTVEFFDEAAFDSVMGQTFKFVVGAALIIGALRELIVAHREASGPGFDKWASAAGWVLAGLVVEILGGEALSASLDALGILDPFGRGIALAMLDVFALGIALKGLIELFKPVPGEGFLKALRKGLMSVMDNAEDGLTFMGFAATSLSVASHVSNYVATGEYR